MGTIAVHNEGPLVTLRGHIENGVVVLDAGSPTLPEGTRVEIATIPETPTVYEPVRIEYRNGLPVVVGGPPGTMHLTNEMIGLVQEQEDLEKMRRCGTQLLDFSIPGFRVALPLVSSEQPGRIALSPEELDRLSWESYVSS